jgi:hypothetical protein
MVDASPHAHEQLSTNPQNLETLQLNQALSHRLIVENILTEEQIVYSLQIHHSLPFGKQGRRCALNNFAKAEYR